MTKNSTNDAISLGLEQLNAVVRAWSTLPEAAAGSVAAVPLQPLTDFSADLREIYADALNRQFDLLLQGATELSGWTAALMPGSQSQGAMETQRNMLASMLEASSQRARIWADMSGQLGTRYAALAHQLAQDVAQTSTDMAASAPKVAAVSSRKKAK